MTRLHFMHLLPSCWLQAAAGLSDARAVANYGALLRLAKASRASLESPLPAGGGFVAFEPGCPGLPAPATPALLRRYGRVVVHPSGLASVSVQFMLATAREGVVGAGTPSDAATERMVHLTS
jgi:hypothetical protein